MNKNDIFNTNLCKEIILSGENALKCVLSELKMPSIKPVSKYNFSRKWHQAEFDAADYEEVHKWCVAQFGPHDAYPDAWSRWNHKFESSILFRDERDYIWFTLRWS